MTPIEINGQTVSDVLVNGESADDVTVNGDSVFSAIPDSVITRDDDNDSFNPGGDDVLFGVEVTTKSEWPEIQFEISSQNQDFTRAAICDSSGVIINEKDISNLNAGDEFKIEEELSEDTTYIFVIGAETNDDLIIGRLEEESTNFPYTTDDIDANNGVFGDENDFTSADHFYGFKRIGNLGL